MIAILSADDQWGIGRDGELLARIPEDMRFFRETTMGHTIVMGRRTLDSLPGGRPLPGRRNIVLTRNTAFAREGVEIVHSPEALAAFVGGGEDVFVIGGGEIYALLLPMCSAALVTRIFGTFGADVFFPNLDALGWRASRGPEQESDGLQFAFCRYTRGRPESGPRG